MPTPKTYAYAWVGAADEVRERFEKLTADFPKGFQHRIDQLGKRGEKAFAEFRQSGNLETLLERGRKALDDIKVPEPFEGIVERAQTAVETLVERVRPVRTRTARPKAKKTTTAA